jgi:hypothetical protein
MGIAESLQTSARFFSLSTRRKEFPAIRSKSTIPCHAYLTQPTTTARPSSRSGAYCQSLVYLLLLACLFFLLAPCPTKRLRLPPTPSHISCPRLLLATGLAVAACLAVCYTSPFARSRQPGSHRLHQPRHRATLSPPPAAPSAWSGRRV